MICVESPVGELSLTVALDGWAPKKVAPGGLPFTGSRVITSVVRVIPSVDPNPLVPLSDSASFEDSEIGSYPNFMNRI